MAHVLASFHYKTPGSKTISASTSYGEGCTPSTTTQHLVNQSEGPSTTTVNVYSTAVGTFKSRRFDAQVNGTREDKKQLQGSVTFTGANTPCTAPLDASGKASCVLSFTDVGGYTIKADFNPADSTLFLASSARYEYVVYGQVAITGTIKPNPAYTTSRVIVEVTVVNKDAGSSVSPEGTVQIAPDGSCIPGEILSLFNGKASLWMTCPTAGTQNVIVDFRSTLENGYFLATSQTIGEIKVVQYEAPGNEPSENETNGQTGGTGCLVDGLYCVDPCPNPSKYTQSCTP